MAFLEPRSVTAAFFIAARRSSIVYQAVPVNVLAEAASKRGRLSGRRWMDRGDRSVGSEPLAEKMGAAFFVRATESQGKVTQLFPSLFSPPRGSHGGDPTILGGARCRRIGATVVDGNCCRHGAVVATVRLCVCSKLKIPTAAGTRSAGSGLILACTRTLRHSPRGLGVKWLQIHHSRTTARRGRATPRALQAHLSVQLGQDQQQPRLARRERGRRRHASDAVVVAPGVVVTHFYLDVGRVSFGFLVWS